MGLIVKRRGLEQHRAEVASPRDIGAHRRPRQPIPASKPADTRVEAGHPLRGRWQRERQSLASGA
jgi:hypothetical protein